MKQEQKKIGREFDEIKAGLPLINFRDNQYWIVDGLHRIAGMKYAKIDKHICMIINVPYEEEIKYFYEQKTKPPTAMDIFKAKIIANEPETLKLYEAISAAGFNIGMGGEIVLALPYLQ